VGIKSAVSPCPAKFSSGRQPFRVYARLKNKIFVTFTQWEKTFIGAMIEIIDWTDSVKGWQRTWEGK
jgi:hypothetical protein